MNSIQQAYIDYETAVRELDGLCQHHFGQPFDLLPLAPGIRTATQDPNTDRSALVSLLEKDKILGKSLSKQEQVLFADAILKAHTTNMGQSKAMDAVLREDRGWPHRSALYFERAACPDTQGERDPQEWFTNLDKNALGICAVQEGDDLNRYVPDVDRAKLTVVGAHPFTMKGIRFEMDLTSSTTVQDVAEAAAEHFGSDAASTSVGFHGAPLHDCCTVLVADGVLGGTIFYACPGWESEESAKKAYESHKKA